MNALVNGDQYTLSKYLNIDSTLASQHSQYGHGATLLLYAVANGVELWRQQIPYNLPELVQIILDHGADTNSKMSVYKGQFTPYELLDSSAHPKEAGVVDELKRLLL